MARIALLWLALLLALAQTVAIQHVYSHSPGEARASSAGKHPGGLAHCDSCIVAAALGGAAPPTVALLLPMLAQQLPRVHQTAAQQPGPQYRSYAIRAPPAIAS